MMFSPLSMII